MQDNNIINLQDIDLKARLHEARTRPITGEISSVNIKLAEEISQALQEMNKKHSFIRFMEGKPAITWSVYNEYYQREIIKFITSEHFMTVYNNIDAPEIGRKEKMTLGQWWLTNTHRREYETATFDPSQTPHEYEWEGKRIFNMWEGFKVEPKKGVWKKTLRHIYEILCNKDRAKFIYVIKWLAWCVQNPGEPAEVAIVFKGKKGAGKGTILSRFKDLFGIHGLYIANKEQLLGKHNAHLGHTCYLFADEVTGSASDRETEGVLKSLITERSLTIEPKFKEITLRKNCLHIAMATNSDWVVSVTEDERRFFINEVDNKYAKNECSDLVRDRYFNELWAEINDKENNGLSAMLYDLLNINLKGYHPRYGIPETEEMRRQIRNSLPKSKFGIMRLLEDGVWPGFERDGKYYISPNNLVAYIQNLDYSYKSVPSKILISTANEIGAVMTILDGKRLLVFPELHTLREVWKRKFSSLDVVETEQLSVWFVETTTF